MTISVLILTLNEERNLPACLEAVKWCDDIVVLDSCSTDRTVEIARSYGARVYQRPFDDERTHRTYSIREIPFRHPWVYNPDADEIATPELCEEMRAIATDPTRREVAFRMRFKVMFMGRWIRYSSLYPTWFMRFFRPDRISFERQVHLHYVPDGPEGRLENHFLHYTFNNGLSAWFEKHNRYSALEALETLESLRGKWPLAFDGLLAPDPVARRRVLKEMSFRVPFRPTLRFLYMYLFRLGFLDGHAGLTYCRLLAIYEYMIVLKVQELRRREQGLTV